VNLEYYLGVSSFYTNEVQCFVKDQLLNNKNIPKEDPIFVIWEEDFSSDPNYESNIILNLFVRYLWKWFLFEKIIIRETSFGHVVIDDIGTPPGDGLIFIINAGESFQTINDLIAHILFDSIFFYERRYTGRLCRTFPFNEYAEDVTCVHFVEWSPYSISRYDKKYNPHVPLSLYEMCVFFVKYYFRLYTYDKMDNLCIPECIKVDINKEKL